MTTENATAKKLRDFASQSGITEKDLVDACRQIIAEADKVTPQGMLEGVRSAVEAAEHPHERIMRNVFGQKS